LFDPGSTLIHIGAYGPISLKSLQFEARCLKARVPWDFPKVPSILWWIRPWQVAATDFLSTYFIILLLLLQKKKTNKIMLYKFCNELEMIIPYKVPAANKAVR